jgi:hypothetical protein
MKTDRLVFQKSGAANIGKRSHSGRDFHSRDQDLIGTPMPQTLEMMDRNDVRLAQMGSYGLPIRRGRRPKTMRGPLHIQCNGHGDLKYMNHLVDEVLTWPHIESADPFVRRSNTIPIRLMEMATSSDPSAFITAREFARVLLGAPTIYLVFPLVYAHWTIVRGWAEPHYLASFGLMPAGAVVVYTPRDEQELGVCYILFSDSYHFALQSSG